MVISDETVNRIMGPEPIPQLDIEMPEIQNELQHKMAEEIFCVMCGNFPYQPLECRNCNKLFCKHCQLQLKQNNDPQNVSCSSCNARGDFLQNLNKVLSNCINFCEFPHKCYREEKHGMIIWKTMRELQEHAMYECPKFGCDICYHEDFQHMTRAQLFQHIKRECPEVMVQCQTCVKDYNRAEFARHECLKDYFLKKLKKHQFEVQEQLADSLMRLRRSKEGLGLCQRSECVLGFKQSKEYAAGQGMVVPNQSNQPCKCQRCSTGLHPYEDSFFCIYCNDTYCPPCLGYTKYFDMDELEALIKSN